MCCYITHTSRIDHGSSKLDGEEIIYSPVNVKVKYENEVRFRLRVAVIKLMDCTIEGQHIPSFECTM